MLIISMYMLISILQKCKDRLTKVHTIHIRMKTPQLKLNHTNNDLEVNFIQIL